MNHQIIAPAEMPADVSSAKAEPISLLPVIRIYSRQIVTGLFCITAVLVMLSLVADYFISYYPPGNHLTDKYIDFFYLNKENNLPTLFSVCLLFIAALLNFTIGIISARSTIRKSSKWYWFVLSAMFVFLGLDEGLQIHDMLSHVSPVEKISEKSSFFYYGWAVPYAIGVLVIGFLFLRFLFALPAGTRNRFIVAGVIYVGGALGLEFFESWAHVQYGKNGVLERTLCTIEETMEMTGSILFIHALLDYIGLTKASFIIGKAEPKPTASSIVIAE